MCERSESRRGGRPCQQHKKRLRPTLDMASLSSLESDQAQRAPVETAQTGVDDASVATNEIR
jgi:hypothetical protein